MSYFSLEEAARRYKLYRPKVHEIVNSWLSDASLPPKFDHALDLACGTGDSTLPLLEISDRVVAIDQSEVMLSHARSKGLECVQSSVESFQTTEKFDLITCCMAFHWFDQEKAISAMKSLSNSNAVWLIYNFYFYGHENSDQFNYWLKNIYCENFPKPPRHKESNIRPEDDSDIELVDSGFGSIPITLSRSDLIGYLTTHSNVEARVQNDMSYQSAEQWLEQSLSGINFSPDFRYGYTYELLKVNK